MHTNRIGRAFSRAIATVSFLFTALLFTAPAHAEPIGRAPLLAVPRSVVASLGRPMESGFSPLARPQPYTSAETHGPLERDEGTWLCLGAACALPRAGDAGVDPQAAATVTGKRLADALGPVATAALAWFGTPVPKKLGSVAVTVTPMFVLAGGGIELRGAWW